MKSFITLAFLVSCVFALSAKASEQSTAVTKCEAKVFVELAEEAVTDVYAFYSSVGASYEGLVQDALQCAANFTDFTDLVSCVADTLTTWVQDFSNSWETLYTDIIALSAELTDDIYSCKSIASL